MQPHLHSASCCGEQRIALINPALRDAIRLRYWPSALLARGKSAISARVRVFVKARASCTGLHASAVVKLPMICTCMRCRHGLPTDDLAPPSVTGTAAGHLWQNARQCACDYHRRRESASARCRQAATRALPFGMVRLRRDICANIYLPPVYLPPTWHACAEIFARVLSCVTRQRAARRVPASTGTCRSPMRTHSRARSILHCKQVSIRTDRMLAGLAWRYQAQQVSRASAAMSPVG